MGARRYPRLDAAPSIGRAGRAALDHALAAVLGGGGIGGEITRHMAMAGIAQVIVDRGRVSEANLGNQGFLPRHLGMPKAQARAEQARELNPDIRVDWLNADIESCGLALLSGCDIALAAFDARRPRIAAQEMATHARIPLVDAAVDGRGAEHLGRVAVFHPLRGSACFACAYAPADLSAIARESGQPCSASPYEASPAAPPTLAATGLVAAAAGAQFLVALEMLLGRGDDLAGTEAMFHLGAWRMSRHLLRRNPACLLGHEPPALTALEASPGTLTVADTFEMAEQLLGEGAEIALHRRALAGKVTCPQCGASRKIWLMLPGASADEARCACGGVMMPSAAALFGRLRRSLAEPVLNRTWGEMGMPPADVISAFGTRGEIHWRLQGGFA